jgi:hypothetical protein
MKNRSIKRKTQKNNMLRTINYSRKKNRNYSRKKNRNYSRKKNINYSKRRRIKSVTRGGMDQQTAAASAEAHTEPNNHEKDDSDMNYENGDLINRLLEGYLKEFELVQDKSCIILLGGKAAGKGTWLNGTYPNILKIDYDNVITFLQDSKPELLKDDEYWPKTKKMINDWMKIILQRNHSFSYEKNITAVADIPELLRTITSKGYKVQLIYFPMPTEGIEEVIRRGHIRDEREGRPPLVGEEADQVYINSYKVRIPSDELQLKTGDDGDKAWTNLTQFVNDKYPTGTVELISNS